MDSITCFRCKQIKDICVSNSNSYYEICVHKTININTIAQNNHHNNDQLVHEQNTDISFNKQHNAQHNEHHNAQHHAQQNEKPIHQILKKTRIYIINNIDICCIAMLTIINLFKVLLFL